MISSETRRLLVTIAVSIGLLWVLARIRFQERTAPPTAVAPVLAQLRPAASYDDLARAVADLRPIVSAAVVPTGAGSAFRISGDRAVTLRPDGAMPVIATDRATQLAVIGVPLAEPAGVIPWMPRVLDYPRFFLVAERAGDSIAIRPIFVGTLTPVISPYWDSEVWHVPAGVDLPPGQIRVHNRRRSRRREHRGPRTVRNRPRCAIAEDRAAARRCTRGTGRHSRRGGAATVARAWGSCRRRHRRHGEHG